MQPKNRPYVYTAFTNHYKYSTVVYAKNVKQARQYGRYETMKVMGKCAVVRRDVVEDMK